MIEVKKRDFVRQCSKYLKRYGETFCLTSKKEPVYVTVSLSDNMVKMSDIPGGLDPSKAVCQTDAVGTEGAKVTVSDKSQPEGHSLPKQPQKNLQTKPKASSDFLDEADQELKEQKERQAERDEQKAFRINHYACGCKKKGSLIMCPIHGRM